jgi:hypothetical protein
LIPCLNGHRSGGVGSVMPGTITSVSDISARGRLCAELAASDFGPFPAIRVQRGCGDLGQRTMYSRQLQAPQRP